MVQATQVFGIFYDHPSNEFLEGTFLVQKVGLIISTGQKSPAIGF